MTHFCDLLPEPPANPWEEVIAAWAALLPSDTVTPVKRLLARQAVQERLLPADLAVILGTSAAELRSFFVRGKPLELEDEAVAVLKRVLKLPAVALRVGLHQLRLTDFVSPSGLGRCQRMLLQQHPKLGAVLDDAQVVAVFALLAGMNGDEPGSERRLIVLDVHPRK